MSTTSLPLDHLAQTVAEREEQLQEMRRELNARQTHLSQLNREKRQLESQLAKINLQIESVAGGEVSVPSGSASAAPAKKQRGAGKITAKVKAKKSRSKKSRKSSRGVEPQGLNRFILNKVIEADTPITTGELTRIVRESKYGKESKNVPKMVQNRVYRLVKAGHIERRGDGTELVPANSTAIGSASQNGEAAPARVKPKKKKASAARKNSATAVKSAAPAEGTQGRNLKDLIVDVLKRSKKPLPGPEIAERVLKEGYQTGSKNFAKSVTIQAGKMKPEGVELISGEGYVYKG